MRRLSYFLVGAFVAVSCLVPGAELGDPFGKGKGGEGNGQGGDAGFGGESGADAGTSSGGTGKGGSAGGGSGRGGTDGGTMAGGTDGGGEGGRDSGGDSGGGGATGGSGAGWGGAGTGGAGTGGAGTGGSAVKCTTPPATTDCQGTCVDTDTNNSHCGTCMRACTGSQTCTSGSCTVCSTGCAVLRAPFGAASQAAVYRITLSPTNLGSARIDVRVFASMATSTLVFLDAYNQAGESAGVLQQLDNGAGWQALTLNFANVTSFNATLVTRIEVSLFTNGSGPWANPTEVYVDSILISNGAAGPWQFASSGMPLQFVASESDVTGTVAWRGP